MMHFQNQLLATHNYFVMFKIQNLVFFEKKPVGKRVPEVNPKYLSEDFLQLTFQCLRFVQPFYVS
jgi:hypothetical protein